MMLTKTAGLSAVKAVGVSAASLRGPFCVSALANAQQQQCRRNFAGGKASAMTTPAPPPAPATSGTPGFERDPEEMRRMSRTREESIVRT
jgi:hypothetical protein